MQVTSKYKANVLSSPVFARIPDGERAVQLLQFSHQLQLPQSRPPPGGLSPRGLRCCQSALLPPLQLQVVPVLGRVLRLRLAPLANQRVQERGGPEVLLVVRRACGRR